MKDDDNLYANGFLTFVTAAQVGDVFVWCSQSCAEMRKGVMYHVDIKLNNCGILESQCECAAGIGPKAHCKHIRAVMCGLCDFTADNQLKPIIQYSTICFSTYTMDGSTTACLRPRPRS